MASMLEELRHQGEVNRLLREAGATIEGHPVLTPEELRLHGLAFVAGVTPREFVNQILAKRGKVAA